MNMTEWEPWATATAVGSTSPTRRVGMYTKGE
jgi:hypothetical protein